MSPHETDLATELRALRPSPRPEFVAELDARAAAGFPPGDGGGSARGRVAAWLERLPHRRLPALAGAAATAAIAIATAVVAISEERPTATRIAARPDSGARLERQANELRSEGFARAGAEAAAAPERAPSSSGFYPTRAARREVERSARIVLASEAAEVRSAAARVYETVRAYDGIVMRSSVRDGNAGQAGAVFSLLIPSGRLGDAMAAFGEIAEVRSRSDAALDVTGPTRALEDRGQATRARIDELLADLAAADTAVEREIVEAKLRTQRRRLASLRSSLAALERRTHLSRVSLRIESETGAGGGAAWGIDDAVDEAGRILTIAAGVTLIGLAVLAPLALLGLLWWFARHRWLRTRRERALS